MSMWTTRSRSLWTSAAMMTRYVLGIDHFNRRMAMLHVPTAKVTYSDLPFRRAEGPVAICPGLALVLVSAPVEPNVAFVLGNPVTGRWKVLATPHLMNPTDFVTKLARNPADASVQLVLYSSDRWDRYDFEADRWITGEVPGENRQIGILSIAWHEGSFYCLSARRHYPYTEEELNAFAETEEDRFVAAMDRAKAKIGDVGDVKKFESLYNPIDVNSYPENEDVRLHKSHVNQAGQLTWKQVELPSEVKRIMEGWEVNHLMVDNGRLLLYSAFCDFKTKHPMQKRRQVQRMFEIRDGKFVEDFAWYDVADELDSAGNIEFQAWMQIGYGYRNKDFFWKRKIYSCAEQSSIYFHSGLDGVVRKVEVPPDWNGHHRFEDVAGDVCKDEFLNVSAGEFKAWSKEELVGEQKDLALSLKQRSFLFKSRAACKNDCRDVVVHREVCLGGKDLMFTD